ncbi:MAG: peptide deformylase [bacterium]|nr:peptide deformylase [bacterium]
MMKIITAPNVVLRQVSTPVNTQERHLQRLLDQLQQTLSHSDIGVGLAAPQIGVNLRVLALKLTPANQVVCYLNPQITQTSTDKTLRSREQKKDDLEGCLSLPKIYAPVPRYEWINVTYQQLENGKLVDKSERFSQFAARVFQHEYDHLDGILFLDRALDAGTSLYYEKNGELTEIDRQQLQKILPNF